MTCACRQKKKKDLNYVRGQAERLSNINKEDVQIYHILLQPIGWIYDFEPINEDREKIVEIIKYIEQ